MGRPKGIKCIPLTVTIPAGIKLLLDEDAKKEFPLPNLSRTVTNIFTKHYGNRYKKILKTQRYQDANS